MATKTAKTKRTAKKRTTAKTAATRGSKNPSLAKAARAKHSLLGRMEALGLLDQDAIERLGRKADGLKATGSKLDDASAWDRALFTSLADFEAGGGDGSVKRVLQAILSWQESLVDLPADPSGLGTALAGLKKIVPYHGATLFLRHPDRKAVEPLVTVGFEVQLVSRIRFEEGSGFSSWVASRRKPVLYASIHRNEAPDSEQVRSFMAIPLVIGGESVGVLNLGHREENAYDAGSLRRLVVAGAILAGMVGRHVFGSQIRAREITDPATGLATSTYLRNRLDEEVVRCRELGHSMSLVTFRLAELGDLSGQYGEGFVERCRRELATLARTWRRPTELVGMGKEDTVVAILPAARRERAEARIEDFANLVRKHNFPRRKRMTVESGLATYPADAESSQELLESVDKSLREAPRSPNGLQGHPHAMTV